MKFQSNSRIGLLFLTFAVVCLGAPLGLAQDSRSRYGNSRSQPDGWTVSESTIISVRMNNSLSSRTARVGDKFTATVAVPVYVNGDTVIPAGTQVEGRVTQVTPAKRMNRSGTIGIDFEQITFPNGSSQRVVGSLTSSDSYTRSRIDDESKVGGERGKNPVVFVGGSGALGAILGGITGGAKGAAVGGAVGAGIGLAGVLMSKGEEAQVPAGTPFGIQLRQPLFVSAANVDGQQSTTTARDQDPPDYGRQQTRQTQTYPSQTPDSGPPEMTHRGHHRSADNRRDTDDPAADARDTQARDSQPRDSYPGDPQPRDSRTRDSQPVDSRSVDSQPADSQPAGSQPADNREAEPAAADSSEPVSLNSPEGIRRAQAALQEQGYYEGKIDGVMSERTSAALKTYQREHKLPESGQLDEATAKSLGINGPAAKPPESRGTSRSTASAPPSVQTPSRTSGPRNAEPTSRRDSVPASVLGASAQRLDDGSIYVLIDTQANTGGWRWFGEQSISGDTLEISARGIPPTGMVTQALTRGRIELTVREGIENVRRVVVHSAGADRVVSLSGSRDSTTTAARQTTGGSIIAGEGASLLRKAQDLFAEFQRITGLRVSPSSGDVENSDKSNEADIEMLFALDGFVRSAQLYARVTSRVTDPTRLREATLSMARQARAADRVVATSPSRAAAQLAIQWDEIRQQVLRLMKDYRIATSEVE
ncbi:MAG TPA: peptidoglycan-binding protein [Blastocatellia bacterium]|nr:peptidoglycan-binding protein [Blastocatellia bacterium]